MSKINISNIVVDNIKRDILVGKYKKGDKLADERTLSEQYGVSRMTIRKALVALRDEKILLTRHGVGTFIENVNQNLLAKKEVNYFLYNEKLIMESLKSRVLVEVEGCGLAAQNATPDDIDMLQKKLFLTIDEIKKLRMGQDNQFFESDLTFHQSIAIASHNSFFPEYLSIIEESISLHQFLSLQVSEPTDEVITYHTAIYGAIISKDAERARNTMQQHLDRVVRLVEKSLKKINEAEPDT